MIIHVLWWSETRDNSYQKHENYRNMYWNAGAKDYLEVYFRNHSTPPTVIAYLSKYEKSNCPMCLSGARPKGMSGLNPFSDNECFKAAHRPAVGIQNHLSQRGDT